MRIDNEKYVAVIAALSQAQNPSTKTFEHLGKVYGVSTSTVRKWYLGTRPRTNAGDLSAKWVAPPPSPPSPAKSSENKARYLRHLAAQALFLAEQLEALAQE